MSPNTKNTAAELSVLLTASEINPRQTSTLAFKDEEWGQLEGKRRGIAAPNSLLHASSHAAAFRFATQERETLCLNESVGEVGAWAKRQVPGSPSNRCGRERSGREAAKGLRTVGSRS